MSDTAQAWAIVVFLVCLVLVLTATAFVHALSPAGRAGDSTAPGLDGALQGLALRLTRLKRDPNVMRIEGRLGGERVSAEVWPDPSEMRAKVRVEAAVPMQLTGTFVLGEDGPRLVSGRAVDPIFREDAIDLALRTLFQRVDEIELGLSGLEGRSRSPLTERSVVLAVEALVALASRVRTDAPPPPDPVARLLATRTRADARASKVIVRGRQVCPFCRDSIHENTPDAVMCAACTTLHHADCWTENGGRCTVRGCERDRAERVAGG